MKNRKIKCVLLLCILFYTVLYRTAIMPNLLQFSESINAAVMIFILFISTALLGFRNSKQTKLKKDIYLIVLLTIFIATIIMYGAGLFTGFLKNSYSLTILSIINNLLGPFILVVTIELFRYIIINSNEDDNLIWIITCIVLILFEVSYSVKISQFSTSRSTFITTTTIIIPIIVKNLLMNYLTIYGGYKPTILYRLVMDLHVYILPIIPDLGDYLNAMKGIIIPIFIYVKCNKLIENYLDTQKKEFKKNAGLSFLDFLLLLILVFLIGLDSGYFPITMLGVGSSSMSPKIKKGDAVIYAKTKIENIKKGDIIVYDDGEKLIIHRVVNITKRKEKNALITKGDANKSEDKGIVNSKNFKGKVVLILPFIGYPGVLISENLN